MDVCVILSAALSLRHRHHYSRCQLAVNNSRIRLANCEGPRFQCVSLHPSTAHCGWTVPPVCYTLPPTVSAISYRGRKCLSNTKITACKTVVSEHASYGCPKCLERTETNILIGTHLISNFEVKFGCFPSRIRSGSAANWLSACRYR
jgi:hypothetical protein